MTTVPRGLARRSTRASGSRGSWLTTPRSIAPTCAPRSVSVALAAASAASCSTTNSSATTSGSCTSAIEAGRTATADPIVSPRRSACGRVNTLCRHFDEQVHFPDLRIEYEDRDGCRRQEDVEITTGHYRGAHAARPPARGSRATGASVGWPEGAEDGPDVAGRRTRISRRSGYDAGPFVRSLDDSAGERGARGRVGDVRLHGLAGPLPGAGAPPRGGLRPSAGPSDSRASRTARRRPTSLPSSSSAASPRPSRPERSIAAACSTSTTSRSGPRSANPTAAFGSRRRWDACSSA